MDTFLYVPHRSTALNVRARVLHAQFGEGYSQEAADGINPIIRDWDCVWENLHATGTPEPTIATLNAFMEAHIGIRFLWVQPPPFTGEGAKVFRVKDGVWSAPLDAGAIGGFRVVFERQPDV